MPESYLRRDAQYSLDAVARSTADKFEDVLFVDERFDGRDLTGKSFKHCTFANISFKESTLEGCTFLDCVFLDCYFRLANIGSKFPASRFISCDFARSKLLDSADFTNYTYWQDCYLKYDEIKPRLPSRLNIRVRLANNLARECERHGESAEARKFRLLAIRSWEEHCKEIFFLRESNYRNKYTGQQSKGAVEYLKSKLQGFIWGYGEKARIPIGMFFALTFVIYPLIFWAFHGSFQLQPGQQMNYWSYLLVSLDDVLPVAGVAPAPPNSDLLRFVIASQVSIGVLYAGIFIALLLKVGQRR